MKVWRSNTHLNIPYLVFHSVYLVPPFGPPLRLLSGRGLRCSQSVMQHGPSAVLCFALLLRLVLRHIWMKENRTND